MAAKVGVSYAQIGRYESKDAQPPAAVLKKIADAPDITIDFLVNGNIEGKANLALLDAEVIRYFKEVDALPQEDKKRITAGDRWLYKRCKNKTGICFITTKPQRSLRLCCFIYL